MCLEVLLQTLMAMPTMATACVIGGCNAMQCKGCSAFRNALCDRATNLCLNVQIHLSSDLQKVLVGVNKQRICLVRVLMTLLDRNGRWHYHFHSLVCNTCKVLHDPSIAFWIPMLVSTVSLEVWLAFLRITMLPIYVPTDFTNLGTW